MRAQTKQGEDFLPFLSLPSSNGGLSFCLEANRLCIDVLRWQRAFSLSTSLSHGRAMNKPKWLGEKK